MYDRISQMPQAESCKEPDWEAEASRMREDIAVLVRFEESLYDFIDVVGTHSLRSRDGNPLAELVGTVRLDIKERTRAYDRVLKRLEGK